MLEMQKRKKVINMDDSSLRNLHSVIKQDSDFLKSKNIMDYSLLLIVEDSQARLDQQLSRNQYMSKDCK
jgi:hypothetical protein